MNMKMLVAPLAVLALVPGLPAGSAAASVAEPPPASPPPAAAQALAWAPCEEADLTGLECASVRVPLDRERVDGRQITLAISRARHTGTSGYQGVLLTNPGGPGLRGRGYAGKVFASLSPRLRARYDVIGIDTRGVGGSEPALSCDSTYNKGPRPDYVTRTPAEEAVWLRRARTYAEACAAANQTLLPHLRTPDTIADFEDIRRALGQDQISFLGHSYGAYYGAAYVTRYPGRVRHMILDGSPGPSRLGYPLIFDAAPLFEDNMNAFFRWVAEHDGTYGLGADAKRVRAAYFRMRTGLESEPALGGTFGPAEMDDTFLQPGMWTSTWPEMAQTLSDHIVRGDSARLAKAYESGGLPPADDNFFAAYNSITCSDMPFPRDFSRWRRDANRAYRTGPMLTWNNVWFYASCMSWKVPAGDPIDIHTGKGAPRILMFQGTKDAMTPYSGGQEMHRLVKSRLVTEVGGRSHGSTLQGNACIDATMHDYLETGRLPVRDTSCATSPIPAPGTATASSPY